MTTTPARERREPPPTAYVPPQGELELPPHIAQIPQLLAVHAAVLESPSFGAAASAFVDELARRYGFDRVGFGVCEGALVRVVAVSGHGQDTIASSVGAELCAVMSEAVSQRCTLQWPPRQGQAHTRITLAHSTLARRTAGSVCSVPVVDRGVVVGAVCFERSGPVSLGPDEPAMLEHVASLTGPVLELIRHRERPVGQRIGARWRAWRARGVSAASRTFAIAAAAAALLAFVFAPLEYRVGGHARVEGEFQRVLVAPADGFLKTVHARPGDAVREDQVLVELAEQDLKLERARIVSPFDGVVIRGDLSQSPGAPVRQGSALITVAPIDRFRLIVEIDERDIALVGVGRTGSVALAALPSIRLPIRVARITPVANAVDGRNVFEVEAALLVTPKDLRPGMNGSARILVDERPLASAWARRFVDWVRFSGWWLFG